MGIEKQAFRAYSHDRDEGKQSPIITVKITPDMMGWFEDAKRFINQPKNSTALKQLALIGAKVITDPKMSIVLSTIFGNLRRNTRMGITEWDYRRGQLRAKVSPDNGK